MAGSQAKAVILVRIDGDDPIRLWAGFGPFEAPGNALDEDPQDYQGLGVIASLPDQLSQLINGVAERVTFVMNGVTAGLVGLASSEWSLVNGQLVNVGVILLDDDLQVSGDVLWLWEGKADTLTPDMQPDEDGNQVFNLELGIGTAMATRARPSFARWTDAQQQRRFPGDRFWDHVPTAEKTKKWPGG